VTFKNIESECVWLETKRETVRSEKTGDIDRRRLRAGALVDEATGWKYKKRKRGEGERKEIAKDGRWKKYMNKEKTWSYGNVRK
jgi:hypothetical protein